MCSNIDEKCKVSLDKKKKNTNLVRASTAEVRDRYGPSAASKSQTPIHPLLVDHEEEVVRVDHRYRSVFGTGNKMSEQVGV